MQRIFVLLCIVLIACSTPNETPTANPDSNTPNPNTPSNPDTPAFDIPPLPLEGYWREHGTFGCGDTDYYTQMHLTFAREGGLLKGEGVFEVESREPLDATFVGKIAGDTITGTLEATIRNYTLPFDVELQHDAEENKLTGSMTTDGPVSCYVDGKLSYDLNMRPALVESVDKDGLEPNNKLDAATPLSFEEIYELSISSKDKDYFSFTLDRTSEITLEAEMLTAMDLVMSVQDADTKATIHFQPVKGGKRMMQLHAGDYYFRVAGKTADQNGVYKFSLKAEVVADAATEPNDDRDTATPLRFEETQTYYGGYGDTDVFKLTLEQDSLVTFISRNLRTNGPVYLRLLNAEGKGVSGQNSDAGKVTYLLDGSATYFVYVDTNGDYTLNASRVVVPDIADEPNNDLATATLVTLDHSADKFLTPFDIDWFRFEVTEVSLVTVSVTAPNTSRAPEFRLFDSDGDLYVSTDSYRDSFTHYLIPGEYHLRVREDFFRDSVLPYTLQLTATPPEEVLEPNDSPEQAASLSLPYIGNSYWGPGDEDWFTFLLSETSRVWIATLDRGLRTSSSITMLDAAGQEVTLPTRPNKARFEVMLDAGIYRLHLSNMFSSAQRTAPNIGRSHPLIVLPIVEGDAAEPNDTSANATPLTLGTFHTGELGGGDHDWFTFTLTESTDLDMSVVKGDESSEFFAVFYKNGEQVAGSFGNGTVTLPAGIITVELRDQFARSGSWYYFKLEK